LKINYKHSFVVECILLQFWAEKAEKVFPNHDVVFRLKVRSYVQCIGRVQDSVSLCCHMWKTYQTLYDATTTRDLSLIFSTF